MDQINFQFQKIREIKLFTNKAPAFNVTLSQNEQYLYAQGDYHVLKIYNLQQSSTKLIIESKCENPIRMILDEKTNTIITIWQFHLIFIYKFSNQCWKILKIQKILLPSQIMEATGLNSLNQFACSLEDKKIWIFQRNKGYFHKIQEIEGTYQFTQIYLNCQLNYLTAIRRGDQDAYNQNTIYIFQFQQSSGQYVLRQQIRKKKYFNFVSAYNEKLMVFGGKNQLFEFQLTDEGFILQNQQNYENNCFDKSIAFFANTNYLVNGGLSKKLVLYGRNKETWEKLQEFSLCSTLFSLWLTKSNILITSDGEGIITFFK